MAEIVFLKISFTLDFASEASGSPSRRSVKFGESQTMRDPHAAGAAQLLQVLVVEISHEVKTHRRYFQDHVSVSFRPVQRNILVNIFIPRRSRRIVKCPHTVKTCDYVTYDRNSTELFSALVVGLHEYIFKKESTTILLKI